mmetsp:Transcript_8958/g.13227  ORF Transcript_8958/g.13227 Transcript_8958/m.13227 type:complete len:1367 (-) Transcript_8958:202-4302(-)|eukprot:CAMPEP_0196809930 /NCGR_PEP_ID=MMETSP1362-20130617/9802_1 /TAXON_ID=163516 /ORGANISM="Leptocylindrus danicus, Strain CCMP1856" /LENGTH=1366 /DNA_ID=CAMNT_0042184775 /DNA_START=48 /DNA_END=4148 /DNA_ORIENTATION=+
MNRRQSAANRARMEHMRNTSTDFDNDVVKRIKQGLCQSCGQRTHKIMLGGLKKVPLDNDKVLKGRCLDCHPLRMSTMEQQARGSTSGAGAGPAAASAGRASSSMATHHEYHHPAATNSSSNTAKSIHNRRDDYSQHSEMSDLTLQTFRSNTHATTTAASTVRRSDRSSDATNKSNNNTPAGKLNHVHEEQQQQQQQSIQSFRDDPYWNDATNNNNNNSNHSTSNSNNKRNPMKLMEDLDELPGGSAKSFQSNAPKEKPKLMQTFKRLSMAGHRDAAAAAAAHQAAVEDNGDDDDDDDDYNDAALPANNTTKIRIEEPTSSSAATNKPLPLFGSNNRRNNRTSTINNNTTNANVADNDNDPMNMMAADMPGNVSAASRAAAARASRRASSAASRHTTTTEQQQQQAEYNVPASVQDRKIKIEEPVSHGQQKPLPLFGSSGRRNRSTITATTTTTAPAADPVGPTTIKTTSPQDHTNHHNHASSPPTSPGEYDVLRESYTEPDDHVPQQSQPPAPQQQQQSSSYGAAAGGSTARSNARERAEFRRLRSMDQKAPPLQHPRKSVDHKGVVKVPIGARATRPGVVRESGTGGASSSLSNDRVARKMQSDGANRSSMSRSSGGATAQPPPLQQRRTRNRGENGSNSSSNDIPPHVVPIINQMKTMTSVPEILDIMVANSQVAKVQEVGCMKFRNLSSHPSFISGIRDAGGIGYIIRALDQHINNKGVQEQGCAALWCLSVNGDENKDAIQLEGGVTSIVNAMREFGGNICLLTWAIGALCSLSYHPTCKVFIGSSGGIVEIVRAMQAQGSSMAVQELGLKCLWNLARESQSNVESICYHDGVTAIVTAISDHSSCDIIQEWGCKVLCVMGSFYNDMHNNDVLRSIVEVGGLAAVVSIMRDHMRSSDVVSASMTFLASTAQIPDCCENIVSAGGIDAVSSAILAYYQSRNGDTIKNQGCSILANLALYSSNKMMFAESKAVEAIMNVLSCRSNSINVYVDSCSVLLNLVLGDDYAKSLILSSNGVDTLTGLLKRPLSKTAQDLMCANLAAIIESSSAIISFLSADGVGTVGTILEERYEEEPVQASTCLLFRNVASNSQGRSEMLEKMVVHAIVNSMRSHPRSDYIQEHACCALWNLSVDDECAAAVSEAEGVAELLSATGHSSEMVVEAACGALMNLTATSDDVRRELGLIDGLDVVLNIIANFQNNIGILVKAIGILTNLCTDNKVAGDLERTDGISKLIQASNIHAYVPQVQEMFCVAIRNLCSKSFPNQRVVLNGGGIEAVVNAILNNKTESVQEEGCACLRTLAGSGADDIKSHIVKAGGIDAIMEVMDEHPTNESLQAEACATIPLLSGAADFQIVLVPRGASTGY